MRAVNSSNKSDKPADEYEIVALAKRLNITLDDMKLRPCQVKGGVVLTPTPFSLL